MSPVTLMNVTAFFFLPFMLDHFCCVCHSRHCFRQILTQITSGILLGTWHLISAQPLRCDTLSLPFESIFFLPPLLWHIFGRRRTIQSTLRLSATSFVTALKYFIKITHTASKMIEPSAPQLCLEAGAVSCNTRHSLCSRSVFFYFVFWALHKDTRAVKIYVFTALIQLWN